MYKLNIVELQVWLGFAYCLIKNIHKAFFTYYIEYLLNFSIPVSHISK